MKRSGIHNKVMIITKNNIFYLKKEILHPKYYMPFLFDKL